MTPNTFDEAIAHWKDPNAPMVEAIIEAENCIGCTKCIKACPFDAIMGAAKWLHRVLPTECTGCGLCVPACPVDCITLEPIEQPTPQHQAIRQQLAQEHFIRHQQRLKIEKSVKAMSSEQLLKQKRRQEIEAALERVKAKRQQRNPS